MWKCIENIFLKIIIIKFSLPVFSFRLEKYMSTKTPENIRTKGRSWDSHPFMSPSIQICSRFVCDDCDYATNREVSLTNHQIEKCKVRRTHGPYIYWFSYTVGGDYAFCVRFLCILYVHLVHNLYVYFFGMYILCIKYALVFLKLMYTLKYKLSLKKCA